MTGFQLSHAVLTIRQSLLRAGGARPRDDDDVAHWEAAEPFAKKRVAFKDDMVKDPEMDDYRSASAPRVHHDALAATPTATNRPPPGPSRFGPSRGRRPGGVGMAGTRPFR